MPRESTTFIYVRFDPRCPLILDEDPALEVWEPAHLSVKRWKRLPTRIKIADSPRDDVIAYQGIHFEERTRLEAKGPDSDELAEVRYPFPRQFSFYQIGTHDGFFRGPLLVLKRFYRRLMEFTNGNVSYVFRVRQIHLENLEKRLRDLSSAEVNIRGYDLHKFLLGGVERASFRGDTLDQQDWVQAGLSRSMRRTVKFYISMDLGDTLFTVHETGEVVMNRDIGIGPTLDFLKWFDEQLDDVSGLHALKQAR